jgi:MYXO-CTERM domain-containing protein
VLNGKGELVGVNFDRVWENVAGDYAYSPERSRNIAVDVRYMLWLLDRVEHAAPLLRELGVEELRNATAQSERVRARGPAKAEAEPGDPEPDATRCSCRTAGAGGGPPTLAALALLFAARRLRRGPRRLRRAQGSLGSS